VAAGADGFACGGEVFAEAVLGDAEVGQVHVAVGSEEDVAGFDVAVDDAVAVGVVQRPGGLGDDVGGLGEVEPALFEQQPLEVVVGAGHDEVEQAVVVLAGGGEHVHDVGVLEVRHELDLAEEPLAVHG
ncbi:hypothetical protein ADL26_15230, partial [Thermoactinomyces vulgaris]